jgi:hypothetical protein
MSESKEQNNASMIGRTYESDSARRGREATARDAQRIAALAAIKRVVDEHRATDHAFTDAELELVVAHPYVYWRGLTAEGAASALIARHAGTAHTGATHVALTTEVHDFRHRRVAYALDEQQTVLAVLDHELFQTYLFIDAERSYCKPGWWLEENLTDAAHPDVLSIELANDYGKWRPKVRWLDVIRGR